MRKVVKRSAPERIKVPLPPVIFESVIPNVKPAIRIFIIKAAVSLFLFLSPLYPSITSKSIITAKPDTMPIVAVYGLSS